MEPKRLKKQLPKILKLLKPEDRILIVGTTHRPFDAELQSFCRVYQKIILVPRPDYASRYGKYLSPLPGCRPRGQVVPYGLKGVWSRGRGGAVVAFVTQGPSEGDERGACVLETQVHRLCSRIRAGNVDTRSQGKHTSVLLIT